MIPFSFNPMGINAEIILTDLDILRQIRDANPTSQLPTLWSEDKDPYTQWEGVTWNASAVINLDVSEKDIQTLQYVNKLTALQGLFCGNNQLSILDVTGLTALQGLYCRDNQLTTLNVTGLTALQGLFCNNNQLSILDVTGLTALQGIECNNNQLSTLNVTGLTALQGLFCNNNQLSILDVTGLTALQGLLCNNNRLTSISTLVSKGDIAFADFTHNLMPATETDRLIAMGFTSAQVLPQDI